MAYAKIFAASVLICAVATALPVQNDDSETSRTSNEINYRLPKNTVPIHYDLKFIPDVTETFMFNGETVIKFKVLVPTSDVMLHSTNLTLNESAMRLKFENDNTIAPEWYDENNETEILTIHFGRPLEVGIYTLSLQFSGALRDDLCGFFKEYYEDNQQNKIWLAATQFQPIYAHSAFPCWDEPNLKATFDISIKHYPNYAAISNMPVRYKSEIDATDGQVWTRFERTPIMSTYLVAFVVADFDNISNTDGTINAWSRKKMVPYLKFAHEIAQEATKKLELYTNSTVPVPKMDHIVLPEHAIGAMENWGLIIYPEYRFTYKEGKSSFKQKFRIVEAVIHELAHQWFGNVVSPTWWSNVWLYEGLASYFQYYIMDKIFNSWRVMDYFVMYVVQGSLSTRYIERYRKPIDVNITTPEQVKEVFSLVVYRKAASILYMLSNIISPEVFRSGIVRFLDEHEYGSANSESMWEALQNALDDSKIPHNDFKVKEVMDTWIKQKRYPLIYVNRDYSAGTMTLTQKDFGLINVREYAGKKAYKDEDERYEWWVPVNYATKTSPDFSNVRPTHWLKPKENLTIDNINPADWVIINKQQSGYYRVTYDDVNWRKISAYLRSENFTNIHVLNRAQMINDITELIIYEHIDPSIFVEVVSYLSQETSYIPWYPMFTFLNNVKEFSRFPSADPIKDFILITMDNLIKDVGFKEHVDDDYFTIIKRSKMLEWACYLGHSKCRQMATAKFIEHFDNPKINRISPNLKWIWVYKYGMRSVNESVWNKVFDSCMKDPSSDELRSLSATENPVLLKKYLKTAVSNDTTISKKLRYIMLFHAFDASGSTSSLVDVLINFYTQHWVIVNESFQHDVSNTLDKIIYRVHTKEQVEKVKKLCKIINEEKCTSSEYWEKKLKLINNAENEIKQWTELLKTK